MNGVFQDLRYALVIKQGRGMAMFGAVAGLFGAWILRRAIARIIVGISSADPATFFTAALLLVAFAAAASYAAARRAAKVDPMVALRCE